MRIILALLLCSFVATAKADTTVGSRDEAVAMTRAAVAMFAAQGPEQTFRAINDKSVATFHKGDLYPFVYDPQGLCLAHGARPALIGKNLYNLKDQDGKYLIREMIERSRTGEGWIAYKWPNPVTGAIEDKVSFYTRMGDYVVGVGVYSGAK